MTVSHAAVEASQMGVPLVAGVALQAALTQWSADVTALRDRMVDFGGALQGFADVVETTDEASGAALGPSAGAKVATR